jgi:outer membrane protein TolC
VKSLLSVFLIINLFIIYKSNATVPNSFLEDLKKISEKNYQLKSEFEKLKAKSEVKFSKSLFWTPQVSLSAGQIKENLNQKMTSSNDFWKLSANLNLYNGLGSIHQFRAASFEEKAQEKNYQFKSLVSDNEAANIIFKNLYIDNLFKSTQNLLKTREDSHRLVLNKFKQGRASQQDVLKSEIDKSAMISRLREIELDMIENKISWRVFLNEDLKTKSWPLDNLNIKLKKPVFENYENQILSLKSKAYYQHWQSSKSQHHPSLDFTLSYQESPFQNSLTKQWTSLLVLTLPLWDQYSTQSKAISDYASYLEVENELKTAQARNSAELTFFDQKLEIVKKNLVDSKKNIEVSKSLYSDMVKAFQYGRISVNDLLIEQNRLIESEITFSKNMLSYHQVLVEGCLLNGYSLQDCFE